MVIVKVVNLEIILFLRWEMLTTAFSIPTILWVCVSFVHWHSHTCRQNGWSFPSTSGFSLAGFPETGSTNLKCFPCYLYIVQVPGIIDDVTLTDLISTMRHWTRLMSKEDAFHLIWSKSLIRTIYIDVCGLGREDMIDPVMETSSCRQLLVSPRFLLLPQALVGWWHWFWFRNSLTTRKALHCKDEDKDKLLSIIGGLLASEWSYLRHLQKKLLGPLLFNSAFIFIF